MRTIFKCIFGLLILMSANTIGCGGDDNPGTPQTGTITINPEPNSIDAPWQIEGPGGFNQSGSGDTSLASMTAGSYALTWGSVSGWINPSPAMVTQELELGGVVTFTGVYIDDPEEFVLIPAGTFTMGSPTNELGHDGNETQHQVTLSHSFYIQATEVTNQQYLELAQWAYDHDIVTATSESLRDNLDGSTEVLKILGSDNYEISFSNGVFSCINPDHPVKYVTWYGSVAYCDWLSLQQGLPRAYNHGTWQCNDGSPYTAAGYRLPTEAEWEYACRAGSTTAFANGSITFTDCSPLDPNLTQMGWYCGNAEDWTHSVAQKNSNAWELYDMHGNAREWCADWYGSYVGAVTDPLGPGTGSYRLVRGGDWEDAADICRSAHRGNSSPGDHSDDIGFRSMKSSD